MNREPKAVAAVLSALVTLATGCSVGRQAVPLPDANAAVSPGTTAPPEVVDAATAAPTTSPTSTEPATAGTSGPGDHLRIGVKFDQPGLGLLEEGDETPSGFDIDVAAYVAWKLGYSPYDIEWVEARSPFREILLDSHEVDMIVASYWWSQERADVVDFAGPYLIVGQDLLVRSDNLEVDGVEDLLGKRVCGVTGSVPMVRIRAMLGNGADYLEETQYSDCVTRLINDEVDAVTTDNLILAGLSAKEDFYGQVRLVNQPFSKELYSIGLPPGSTDLCERVNEALVEMIADGSWQRFIARHTDGTDFTVDPDLNPPQPQPCR